jgi:hypothetical protein
VATTIQQIGHVVATPSFLVRHHHNSSSHLRSLTLSHIVSQSQIEIGTYLNIRIFSSRSAEAALSQPDSANTQLTIATHAVYRCIAKPGSRASQIPKISLNLIMTCIPGPLNTPDACRGETKYCKRSPSNQDMGKPNNAPKYKATPVPKTLGRPAPAMALRPKP